MCGAQKAWVTILAPPPCSGRRTELPTAFPCTAHTRFLQLLTAQSIKGETAFSSWSWWEIIHRVWTPGHFATAVGQLTRRSSGHHLYVPVGLDPQLFHAFKPFSSSNSPKLCLPKLSMPMVPLNFSSARQTSEITQKSINECWSQSINPAIWDNFSTSQILSLGNAPAPAG